ncbi:hypothetical protein ACSQ67_014554 [Phaseolus vulgaris]
MKSIRIGVFLESANGDVECMGNIEGKGGGDGDVWCRSQGRGGTTSMEGNKLVSKISNLVEEDRIVALREVLVRVNELREHFGFRVLEKWWSWFPR